MSGHLVQGVHALESETKGGNSKAWSHDEGRQLGRLVVYTWWARTKSNSDWREHSAAAACKRRRKVDERGCERESSLLAGP